jgi:hypothetical protein
MRNTPRTREVVGRAFVLSNRLQCHLLPRWTISQKPSRSSLAGPLHLETIHPRDAQRAAHLAEVASQAHSIFSPSSGKRSENTSIFEKHKRNEGCSHATSLLR